jgi:hypothetical protein
MPRRGQASGPQEVARVPPVFKLVFLSVFLLTIGLIVVDILLAVMVKEPSDAVSSAIETCDTGFKAGIGAIFGLLGGKSFGVTPEDPV